MKPTRIETDDGQYYIELRDITNYLFGVFDKSGRRKQRNLNSWDYEPQPSSRTNEWIEQHLFTFKEAKKVLGVLEILNKVTKKKLGVGNETITT